MTKRFDDKVVVVTGAAGGIGRATVARLVDEGARVVAVDLSADALADACGGHGDAVRLEAADVTREDDTKRYLDAAVSGLGQLDALFAGAGIIGPIGPLESTSMDDYHRVMAVNVTGVFLAMKHAIPILKTQGKGAIVNAASTAGLQASGVIPVYSATKHAVVGLTRAAAALHARDGIRINAVCPGPIDTAMVEELAAGMEPDDPAHGAVRVRQRVPTGRAGEPAEVAAVIAFLCSDEASFVNGSLYTVDGGMSPF